MLHFIKKTAAKIIGNHSDTKIKQYTKNIQEIEKFDEEFKNFTQEECQNKLQELKNEVQAGKKLSQVLPASFALTRKAASETIGERHYDVQLIGAMALNDGQIAEMKTGEGKTLTATLAVCLNTLEGKGVHVVTVNDYLASRDSEWMGKVYQYLGLTTGVIQNGMNDDERRAAYQADITYGTNNEFGFDYLRDNMKFQLEDYTQRELNYAIIDEVDSVLIDEARTPLIISGLSVAANDKYLEIDKQMLGLLRAFKMIENHDQNRASKELGIEIEKLAEHYKTIKDNDIVIQGDYLLDEKSRNIQLTSNGIEKIEQRLKNLLNGNGLFEMANVEYLHHVNQALKARYVFVKDKDYVVENGEVKLVDEFTGRIMEGRRFSDGLHQALEAKENVKIENENQTLASITFQNYFRRYKKISGMTGTALTEKSEFAKIYGLGVISIPTNQPMVRIDAPDLIYKTEVAKYNAIVNEIKAVHKKGQPILVGTDSIENSEALSKKLEKAKIPHKVLNAKKHAEEAEIIKNAGRTSAVTISTNMAGRGTDIKLTEEVKKLGGLYILGTVRHESRRIDNQLRGRSGRQGDAGMSRFYLSLDDDLLRIFGGERIANLMTRMNIGDNEAIEHNLISKAIENAQKKVESQNFAIRKHLLDYDDVMNRQREIIYKQRREILGGEVKNLILDMSHDVIDELIDMYCRDQHIENWDKTSLLSELKEIYQIQEADIDLNEKLSRDEIAEEMHELISKKYDQKSKEFLEHSENIERQILLEITDQMWKEHLLNMDHLKEGIGLRSFAQKNPLDEYKKEAFQIFIELMNKIARHSAFFFFNVQKMNEEAVNEYTPNQREENIQYIHGNMQKKEKEKVKPIRKTSKIERNQPCPCGSGKKYKNCHNCEYKQNLKAS